MVDITTQIAVDNCFDVSITLPLSSVNYGSTALKNDEIQEHLEYMPIWEGGSVFIPSLFPTVDRDGIISGTVKVQGVLKERARVSLYFRKTGALIQSTLTDKDGAYFFQCGLNRNVADYYAVAICDDPFNGQVFDKLTPL